MVTGGVDAGGECLKVVLFEDGGILSWHRLRYGKKSVATAAAYALEEATQKAGVSKTEVQRIMATGNYRKDTPFSKDCAAEATCCARGASLLVPTTRTIVDLGVDKSVVLKTKDGVLSRIARNDKCAAGTGRYVSTLSKLMQIDEDEAGRLSLQSKNPVDIRAVCTVFMESEVISLIHQGKAREDILKGAFKGLVRRIYPLLLKVGFEKDVTLVGGIAKNIGIINAFEKQLGFNVLVPDEPSIAGALGAAIIAGETQRDE